MGEVLEKAFAVSETAVKRRNAYSPQCSGWTLYDPSKLAEKLEMPVEVVDQALEETGFNKAVRIREEVIRWKERLRREERELCDQITEVNKTRRSLANRQKQVREQLEGLRNILRLPREKP